ncbi:MAG: hypothetical protein GWP08_14875 [Nitrospiraceae bacterium]|nr:hypothetical protein [Nitrospiraceae bacterium]
MASEKKNRSHDISTLNEKDLHAALKQWYAEPGDEFEVPVAGSLIDIVRGDLLIEIQTRNFAAMKRKLKKLLADHRVRLVHPIPFEKWIVRLSDDKQEVLGRRKSPKRGCFEDVFDELMRIPHLMTNPNFTLEILLIREEEVRCRDGSARAWRKRGWVTQERRLLEVVARRTFETPADLLDFVGNEVADPFTTADLAQATGRPRWQAQRMAYCLRAMDVIEMVDKQGNAIVYKRTKT